MSIRSVDVRTALGERLVATLESAIRSLTPSTADATVARDTGFTGSGTTLGATPRGGDRLLRWLLAAGAVFLAWKLLRGLKSLAWTAFGLMWVLIWTQPWRWF